MRFSFPPPVSAFALFLTAQALYAASIGPLGTYYGSDTNSSSIIGIQGNSTGSVSAQRVYESPLAVLPDGTVTTNQWVVGAGGIYSGVPSVSLTQSGLSNASVLPNNTYFDGTTNGTSIFTVSFYGGQVYRLNTDWSNPTLLFNAVGDSSGINGAAGITFDWSNNSLWILDYYTGNMRNYTMSGTILSSFATNLSWTGGLAMDLDGSLWFSRNDQSHDLVHYSTNGTYLGSLTFTNPTPSGPNANVNFLGAEIGAPPDAPEPGTLLLVTLPLAGMGRRRFCRRAR